MYANGHWQFDRRAVRAWCHAGVNPAAKIIYSDSGNIKLVSAADQPSATAKLLLLCAKTPHGRIAVADTSSERGKRLLNR
jgi:hypothetical protein